MPGSNAQSVPAGLFTRLASAQASLADLQAAAQLAMQVEFTTIPVYRALRSVVVEEMFHFNQAANILVTLGGSIWPSGANATAGKDAGPRACSGPAAARL